MRVEAAFVRLLGARSWAGKLLSSLTLAPAAALVAGGLTLVAAWVQIWKPAKGGK